MNFIYILGSLCFINQIIVMNATEGNMMKQNLSKSYSCLYFIQMKIRNSLLKRLVQSDYKTIKKHVFLMTDCAKEKISNTYEDFLNNYYNNVLHYYSMDEKDIFMIDHLSQLLL